MSVRKENRNGKPFTTQEFMDWFEAKTDIMVAVCKKKNADYSGADNDPFLNFKRVEAMGIATTEQGFLTRMTDKMCRIANLTKNEAQVKDESIQDTLLDLANYSLLLAGYLESKKRESRKS